MTYQDLYDSALRLIASDGQNGDTSDYLERAPYLLASLCTQCAPTDAAYRRAHGLGGHCSVRNVCVNMTDTFALCDVFSAAAVYYLASMLVLEENEDLSERFFDLYSDAISSVQGSLPASCEKIINRYPGLL